MKVGIFDKNIRKNYSGWLTSLSVILSIIVPFVDIPSNFKIYYGCTMLVIIISYYFYSWKKANDMCDIEININNTTIKISEGDIFSNNPNEFKVIGFNEYFDTEVDDIIISSKTLNGKYIKQKYNDVSVLDKKIENDIHLKQNIINNVNRVSGKRTKYKLGTIFKDEDYFLVALSKFDEDNRAYLEVNEYINCLMNFWNKCDVFYSGYTVVMPLLGSGITRFHGYEEITDQEILEIILWTFKVSKIKFKYPSSLKIVLTNNTLKKINLYEIKNRFDE